MKHIDLRADWLKQMKDREQIEFNSIDGKENPADFYTKIYDKKSFRKAQAKLMGKLPKFLCCSREPADITSDGANNKEAPKEQEEELAKSSICQM